MQVCRDYVDNYTIDRALVTCQVGVYWVGSGDRPMLLFHRIKLLGAKSPFDFLAVTSPTHWMGRFRQSHSSILCIGV